MLGDERQDKIFKYLAIGLAVVSVGILVKEFLLKPEELPEVGLLTQFPKVEIDFEFLEGQTIKDLSSFEKASPPENIGRENLFEFYQPSTSTPAE